MRLNDSHIKDILSAYDFSNKSKSEQAQLLLMLSGVFTTYSSVRFFGTEYDSPLILRYYAYMLMEAARRLDETVVPNFEDWTNKLLGVGNSWTCTGQLSSIIINHCKTFPNYMQDLSGLIPPEWQ